jgi:hypothetical protein
MCQPLFEEACVRGNPYLGYPALIETQMPGARKNSACE